MQCQAVATYTRDGVGDWTYHCPLEEDHEESHDWTLDSGQDPIPEEGS